MCHHDGCEAKPENHRHQIIIDTPGRDLQREHPFLRMSDRCDSRKRDADADDDGGGEERGSKEVIGNDLTTYNQAKIQLQGKIVYINHFRKERERGKSNNFAYRTIQQIIIIHTNDKPKNKTILCSKLFRIRLPSPLSLHCSLGLTNTRPPHPLRAAARDIIIKDISEEEVAARDAVW